LPLPLPLPQYNRGAAKDRKSNGVEQIEERKEKQALFSSSL